MGEKIMERFLTHTVVFIFGVICGCVMVVANPKINDKSTKSIQQMNQEYLKANLNLKDM